MVELRVEQVDSELPGFAVYRLGRRIRANMPYAEARQLAIDLAIGDGGEAVEVGLDGTRTVLTRPPRPSARARRSVPSRPQYR